MSDARILRRLWDSMRPYRGLFLLSLVLIPVISGLNLLQPHLIQLAVDDHITPGRADGLATIVAIFALAIVGAAALQYAQFYVMQLVAQRALHDLRCNVFDHLTRLRLAYFHRTPTGRLMTRVTTDIESLQEAFAAGMVTILGDLIALAAIVVILLVKDWRLALATFAVVPLLLAVTVTFRLLMRRAFRELRVAIARVNAFFQEHITGIVVVQLFVQERRAQHEFAARARELRDAAYDSIKYDATFYALIEAIGAITTGVIIWYGSGGALEGAITLGLLISFIEYVEKFFRPIRDLTQKYTLLQGAMASSERIYELLDTDERIPDPEEARPITALQQRIEFRDVWFSYDLAARPPGSTPTPEDLADDARHWVLRGVSFTLPRGARVALVGHTGAGKSTITRLLTRQYDVQRGQILVDGVDLRDLRLDQLRRLFAVVLQDVFMFTGTVLDNITLDNPAISAQTAREAAALVHADRFVARLPRGFDTPLAERGANLSAGERQLLAFARALAHRPQVLILDEATSSVDTDTEQLVQQATARLLAEQTSLVVAHRLSTIRNCDTILLFHHGELREQGTHDALVAARGLYETLYRLQLASPTSDRGPGGAALVRSG